MIKKMILMLLVLVGGVVSANADAVLKGSFDSWGTGLSFDSNNECYLSLYNITSDVQFKIYDTQGNGSWHGINELDITAPTGWYTNGDDGNVKLQRNNIKNSSNILYDVVKFTAIWDQGWKLTIEGVEKQSFTVYFVNGQNWTDVYGYFFDSYGNSGWTDHKLSKSSSITVNGNSYDVYTYTFEREFAPKVIFHKNGSGDGAQTGDLDVVNNKLYLLALPDHYAVVGDNTTLFGSAWDGTGVAGSTTFMTLNNGIYEYPVSDVTLSSGTTIQYKVVKRKFNLGDDKKIYAHTADWYPNDNMSFYLPAGKYDITFKFDTSDSQVSHDISAQFVTLTPAKTYTTLTSAFALDFTDLSLTAYVVKDEDVSDDKVTMTQVKKIPAETGLVIKAENINTPVNVPALVGAADDVTGNKMEGSSSEETEIAANAGYILSNGAFHPSSGVGKLAAGKAYLHIAVPTTGDAPALSMDFGDETTSIQSIERTINDNQYYTLDGRRVYEPTKGLYIVNGKKVVIK